MVHVGMDLHHRNSYVVAITQDGRKLPGRRIYHDRIEELWQYLGQFGDQPKRVVFEAISNSRWMYRLLKADPTIEPVAVTPHKVRIIAETVAKTDKIDAGVLALLSKLDTLPRSWLPDEQLEQLREMTRYRAALVRIRRRAKCLVNSVLARGGLIRPYQDIFGTWGRQWLEQAALPEVMRLQVDNWLNLIDLYDQKISQAEKKLFGQMSLLDRWKGDVLILRTIPGVGPVTALTILAELGDYRRFKRRSAVSCFAGLVPWSRQSDKTRRYGSISKRGSRALRSVLVEVAITSARKVPRYAAMYENLRDRKGVKKARVAVARQLLEDAWTILIKHEPFRLMPVQAESLARAG